MFREECINDINIQLKEINKTDVTILWGMGEYTEKLYYYTEISNYHFENYVDNKFYGQERFGQFIKQPRDIQWNHVTLVVISAFYKWKEIEQELKEKLKYNGKVLVLKCRNAIRPFYQYESKNDLLPSIEEEIYLKKNQKYEDKYLNQKCYILGNGPSLEKNSIDSIKKEIVFSVNEFFRYNKAHVISPNYYVVADPVYFNLKHEEKLRFFTGLFGMKKANPNIKFWFPISVRPYVENEYSKYSQDIHYFAPFRNLDWVEENRINFIERVPNTYSVIQYTILLAIYMGFKEIYLLGCEQTNIIENIKNYIGDCLPDYVYDISKKERKWCAESCKRNSLENLLFGYYEIFKGYRKIHEICSKRGIKLVNCIDKTYIEDIPRGNFII